MNKAEKIAENQMKLAVQSMLKGNHYINDHVSVVKYQMKNVKLFKGAEPTTRAALIMLELMADCN